MASMRDRTRGLFICSSEQVIGFEFAGLFLNGGDQKTLNVNTVVYI